MTAGKLPEAELAFLDELFKGSSAILNTLLKMLIERVFENDGVTVPVPLKLCLAASNEWPQAYEGARNSTPSSTGCYSARRCGLNKGKEGYTLREDPKARLYIEFLQLIGDHWPAVFVMENIKGVVVERGDKFPTCRKNPG